MTDRPVHPVIGITRNTLIEELGYFIDEDIDRRDEVILAAEHAIEHMSEEDLGAIAEEILMAIDSDGLWNEFTHGLRTGMDDFLKQHKISRSGFEKKKDTNIRQETTT